MQFNLFIFTFVTFAFGVKSKKLLLKTEVEELIFYILF